MAYSYEAGGTGIDDSEAFYGYFVKGLTIGVQSGSSGLMYATWYWNTKIKHIKGFHITWKYYTGDGIWFVGSDEETDKYSTESHVTATYSPPQNATRVSCTVKPVSDTYDRVSYYKGMKITEHNAKYWNGISKTSYYIFPNVSIVPETPATPSVAIDSSFKLKASVNVSDSYTTYIEFQIVQDNKKTIGSGISKVTTNYAAFTSVVEGGHEYKVRARGVRPVKNSGKLKKYLEGKFTYTDTDGPKSAEVSDWSEYSANVATIPGTPKMQNTFSVRTETSVEVYWSKETAAESYTVEYTTSKRFFDRSTAVKSQTSTVTSAIIEGLDTGKYWYFRVKATNQQGDSGWSNILPVLLGSVPSAPTTWSQTSTAIVGDNVLLYWMHNSEDGSTQKKAEVMIKVDNGSWKKYSPTKLSTDESEPSYYRFKTTLTETTTMLDSSGASFLDSSGSAITTQAYSNYAEGVVVRWKVRTRGIMTTGGKQNDGFSPWSTERVVVLYGPPILDLLVCDDESDITVTSEPFTSYPIYIKGSASPTSQTPVGWNVTITANESYDSYNDVGQIVTITEDDVIFSEYIAGDGSSSFVRKITAGDANFENDISYTVKVVVAMDSGLTAESSQVISFDWDNFGILPNAEIEVDSSNLCAYIRPFCVDEDENLIDGVTLAVYRRDYDGGFTLIADDIANDMATVITDPHPSLDYARYRIVSTYEETGQISFYDLPGVLVGETGIVIQWNEQWMNFNVPSGGGDGLANSVWSGSIVKLPYNVNISESTDIDKSLVEYIGRSSPVSYYGTQLGVTGSWSSDIPADDEDTRYALRRLQVWPGDAYVRAPNGVGYWASVNVSFNKNYDNLLIPVTVDVTRVEGGI